MTTVTTYPKEHIQSKIADHFGIPFKYILLPSRGKSKVAWIRQVYVYCLFKFSDLGVKEIGVEVGRHYSVVTYTVKFINDQCKTYPDKRKEIIEIEGLFE